MISRNKRGSNLGGVFFTATELQPPDPQMGRTSIAFSLLLHVTRMETVGEKMKIFSKLSIFCASLRLHVQTSNRMLTCRYYTKQQTRSYLISGSINAHHKVHCQRRSLEQPIWLHGNIHCGVVKARSEHM